MPVVAAVVLTAAWVASSLLLWPTDVPDDLHLPQLDPERYFSDRALERAHEYEPFVRINSLLSQVVLVIVLAIYAVRGARFARESAAGRIGTGMLLAMLGLGLVWLVQLPFGIVGLWWDRRHDVSEQGYFDWIVGSWFGLGGEFLFVCLGVLVVMALAGLLRDRWWIAGAPAFVALALGFAFVQPYLRPDLKPLKDDRLEAQSRQLAKQQGLPEIPVKVEEVREFTTAPNAEATGLGPSRGIILWDTLVYGDFSRPEVRSIVAHEYAHHSRNHIWEGLGWFALLALPAAFVIARTTRGRGGMYRAEAVPLALLVLVLLQLATTPLQNIVSRRAEAEADWVALESTRDPRSMEGAFESLATTSRSDPDPPSWSQVLLGTHPEIIDRIAMAEAWLDRRTARHVDAHGNRD